MDVLPPNSPSVRLLRIGVSHDVPVYDHPKVAPLLRNGWRIKSKMPRLVEGEGVQLFIVLTRPAPPSA